MTFKTKIHQTPNKSTTLVLDDKFEPEKIITDRRDLDVALDEASQLFGEPLIVLGEWAVDTTGFSWSVARVQRASEAM